MKFNINNSNRKTKNNRKSTGASSIMEYDPKAIKRIENRKKQQEKGWAAKAGPVTVRNINDEKSV